jgi:two-component system, OmpR family, sensor histidine kinase ChvG
MRLGQVINNLLDNARSFSPPGGTIHVRARRQKQDVEIAVEDDGPGIPPGSLRRIFDRFYTDRGEGVEFGNHSGLGLSISRQIIEAHGGRIWAENCRAPENAKKTASRVAGARFVVRLPART